MDSSFCTPTSELEAINTMLSVIGESPINSLEGDLPADVTVARHTLGEICREVQSTGWYFNTEYRYPLTVDANSNILIPSNAVHVDPDKHINAGIDAVVRGNKLYNLTDHTFIFGGTIYATIIFLLDFTEIPQAARHYITIRAARKFHDRVVGSGTLHDFSERDELDALIRLKHEDSLQADRSIFGKNIFSGWNVAKTIWRNR